jgi:putative ABC transport system permease protein
MASLGQDLRYAARSLSRSPGFTLVAVSTLALGIGANSAVFSIVRGVLLAPLPYADAPRVVVSGTSLPDYEDLRRQTTSFESSAVYASNLYNVGIGDDVRQLRGAVVTGDFFRVLGGMGPVAGRTLGPEDATAPVAVLSETLARRLFPSGAAGIEAVGETLRLGGRPFTIVGVMPAEFEFPRRQFDFWVPLEHELARTPGQMQNRSLRIFRLVARLKPGTALAAARAEVEALSKRLEKEYPDSNTGFGFELVPLPERLLGGIRPALWTLLAAVGLVLLIATANVANLLLARGAARSRELAIRSALGAGRGRLMRQLLTESLALSLAGAALGALVGAWAVSALPLVAPDDLPRLSEIRLDPLVLGFTLAAGLATGLVFGIAPALQATRRGIAGAASDASRGSSTRQGRLRGGLVVAEVAFAVVVLVGAGLLGRSLHHRLSVEKGFRPEGVTSFNLNLFELEGAEARARAAAEAVKSLKAIPGVSTAAAGTALPPQTAQRATQFEIDGRPFAESEDRSAYFVGATPGLFLTLGTKVVEGREFADTDRADAPPVAIVSRSLAKRLFPDGPALGRRLRILNPDAAPVWREIVGVVEDVRYSGLEDPGENAIYSPFDQTPFLWAYVFVRSAAPAATLAPSIAEAVRRVHPALLAADIRPMEGLVSVSVAGSRFQAALLSSFAALALLLSALGLYGVVSYGAALRRREIGIRIALGARGRQIVRLVAGGGLRLVAWGLLLGTAAALAASRLLESLLFGVHATDPPTYAAIAAVMLGVGLLAGALPARRASKIDPIEALRSE